MYASPSPSSSAGWLIHTSAPPRSLHAERPPAPSTAAERSSAPSARARPAASSARARVRFTSARAPPPPPPAAAPIRPVTPRAKPPRPPSTPNSSGRAAASVSAAAAAPRRHAADDMVVPTLAHRGAALDPLRGGGSASAAGLVPIGRDSPIGLNLDHFMGSPSPFGQPTRSSRDLPDDEARSLPALFLLAIRTRRRPVYRRPAPHHPSQALTALTEPADAMRTILSARLAHLRAARRRPPRRAPHAHE